MLLRLLRVGAVLFALSTLSGLVLYAGCRAKTQPESLPAPESTPSAVPPGANETKNEAGPSVPPVLLPESKAGPVRVMPATKSGRFLPPPSSEPAQQTQPQAPNAPKTPMPATKAGPFLR
jgi:hypothetical protein